MSRKPSPYVALLVVRIQRLSVRNHQVLSPPLFRNMPVLGINVSFQYVLAYPGQLAALRPYSLMYQLEQPAANTDPSSCE